MKIVITALLLLLVSFCVVAQKHKIDSTKTLLRKHTAQDTISVINLYNLSYFYAQTQPDSALKYGNLSLQLSHKLGYKRGEGWALNRLAYAFWMKAKYPTALKYCYEALEIFEKLGDKKGLANTYNSLAINFGMQESYQKSLEFYQKFIVISEELKDTISILKANANIGRTYFLVKQYAKALEYLNKVLNSKAQKKDILVYSIVLNTSADVYQAQNNLDKALKNYFEALKITDSIKVPRIISYSTRGISEIYQKRNNLSESNLFAERTLKISKEIGYIENVKNAALILSNNYKKQGVFDKALTYYVEYEIAKDSMFNIEKEKIIQKMQESYEVSQKQKEIELLKTKQKLQEEASARQTTFLYGLITVIVLISILIVFLYRSNLIKQKTNKLLTVQRNRLAEQNMEINQQKEEILSQAEQLQESIELKDKLFSIIAHDLRSPFNSLLMITQYLDEQMFSPEELKSLKEKLYTNTKSLSDMLNNLLLWAKQQMSGIPSNNEPIDLRELVDKNLKVFEIPALEKEITLEKVIEENPIAIGDVNQIDCVLRNLLNNAIKFTHHKGKILVKICQNSQKALVAIQDNGVGIPQEKIASLFDSSSKASSLGTAKEVGTGLGLLLCKDFILNNGGKIWVDSQPAEGTTFYFTLPLASKIVECNQ